MFYITACLIQVTRLFQPKKSFSLLQTSLYFCLCFQTPPRPEGILSDWRHSSISCDFWMRHPITGAFFFQCVSRTHESILSKVFCHEITFVKDIWPLFLVKPQKLWLCCALVMTCSRKKTGCIYVFLKSKQHQKLEAMAADVLHQSTARMWDTYFSQGTTVATNFPNYSEAFKCKENFKAPILPFTHLIPVLHCCCFFLVSSSMSS